MGLDQIGDRKIDAMAELKAEYRAILNDDPVWTAYAIADLQPKYDEYCVWGTNTQHNTQEHKSHGLVLLFEGLNPPILLAAGDPEQVRSVLDKWDGDNRLPSTAYLSMREEHEPVLLRYYDNSKDRRRMWRMALEPGQKAGGKDKSELSIVNSQLSMVNERDGGRLRRLGPADGERIRRLYAHGGPFTPDAYDPWQLEEGVFFGVEGSDGELLAVGGTHIVDWDAGIGTIGNMYTHPVHRGCGYATQVLGAIVGVLQSRNLGIIILNVDHRNEGARKLYERFGFRVHCPYLEGVATRR